MTGMSLNTAIFAFAFSGMLAPRRHDDQAPHGSSHAADEAASRRMRPDDGARPADALRRPG